MNFVSFALNFLLAMKFCIGDLNKIRCFYYTHNYIDFYGCCEGYKLINSECIPICEGGCPDSQICLEPNVCGCFDNPVDDFKDRCYICNTLANNHCYVCKPKNSFINGTCTSSCHELAETNGYFYSPGLYNCSSGSGYRDKGDFSSSTTDNEFTISTTNISPDCQNGCLDGICTDGICQKQETTTTTTTRDKNFTISTTHDTSNCQNNCHHGICNQDKLCQCNQGYTLHNGHGCVPKCDRECVNSICITPSQCECFEGDISRFNISSAVRCHSTCEGLDGKNGCPSDFCVAANKCECRTGFFPKPGDRFECVASLEQTGDFPRKFFYIMWIIVTLTVIVIILLGYLALKRMKRVDYNVDEIEKIHSTVVFQSYDETECAL